MEPLVREEQPPVGAPGSRCGFWSPAAVGVAQPASAPRCRNGRSNLLGWEGLSDAGARGDEKLARDLAAARGGSGAGRSRRTAGYWHVRRGFLRSAAAIVGAAMCRAQVSMRASPPAGWIPAGAHRKAKGAKSSRYGISTPATPGRHRGIGERPPVRDCMSTGGAVPQLRGPGAVQMAVARCSSPAMNASVISPR